MASSILLKSGLNLNASKTKVFSRKGYRNYRALELLEAVSRGDADVFARRLKSIERSQAGEVRLDTVFRASIGFVFRNRRALTVSVENFIANRSAEYQFLCLLNGSQFNQLVQISRDSNAAMERFGELIARKPYAAAKANYLHFIRKFGPSLVRRGASKRRLANLVERIVSRAEDSTLISEFCGPAAMRVLS